jgi:hypothetical protein
MAVTSAAILWRYVVVRTPEQNSQIRVQNTFLKNQTYISVFWQEVEEGSWRWRKSLCIRRIYVKIIETRHVEFVRMNNFVFLSIKLFLITNPTHFARQFKNDIKMNKLQIIESPRAYCAAGWLSSTSLTLLRGCACRASAIFCVFPIFHYLNILKNVGEFPIIQNAHHLAKSRRVYFHLTDLCFTNDVWLSNCDASVSGDCWVFQPGVPLDLDSAGVPVAVVHSAVCWEQFAPSCRSGVWRRLAERCSRFPVPS